MATAHSDFQEVGTLLERFTKISPETKRCISGRNRNQQQAKAVEEWQKDFESRSDPADARFELRGEDPEQRAARRSATSGRQSQCSASRREVRPAILRNPRNGKDAFACAATGVALRVGKVSRYMTAPDIAGSVRSELQQGRRQDGGGHHRAERRGAVSGDRRRWRRA